MARHASPTLIDWLLTHYQFLLPQHLVSRLVFRLTRVRWRPLKNLLIRSFIRIFAVDMSVAKLNHADDFIDFNAFFTRELREGARPMPGDANALACPVDGTISQFGTLDGDRILQAKGHDYRLSELAVDETFVRQLTGGQFITIYLSPRDYHRIHMPADASLHSMLYVPGHLFSVNERTTRMLPGLFTRNERIVNFFETEAGPMALVMVGAINVGCMETVWQGMVTPAAERQLRRYGYHDNPISLERGEEMGRFNMGSTVILLFPPDCVSWRGDLQPGQTVRLGETLGRLVTSPAP